MRRERKTEKSPFGFLLSDKKLANAKDAAYVHAMLQQPILTL